MVESGIGSQPNPDKEQPDLYSRISNALKIEDRDWNTVSRRVATRLLAGGGMALAAMAAGVAGFRAVYASKIYPNIYIGDVNVGGMTAEEAREAVQARVDEFDTTAVKYTHKDLTWTPTLTELGVSIDVDALVERALELGRDEKAADRLLYTSNLAQGPQVIPMQYKLQPRYLNNWFDTVEMDIGDPAIDATFTVSGSDLIITDDSTGTGADREAVTAALYEAIRTLKPISGALPTDIAHPRITKADLEANEEEVLQVLSNSVGIRFEGQRWELLPEEISEFLIFTSKMENGQAVTSVDFDRTRLAQFLREKFGDSVNRMPINAKVQFYNGKLTATSKSTDGKAMKASEFADMVAASFLGNHERVDIPVATTPAKVREDNLDTLGIKDRLCRVDSNFTSDLGTDREHNVMVGIRLLNNVIIPPGEDFSFNKAIGSIAANPDFIGGTGIVAGVIQDEFGGGICQVTTTAFRAGIMAGLPITAWDPHTYRLTGYERDGWGPGFDASIFQPDWLPADEWSDLRFTNNTGNYILISSWADNGIHVVEIYGTDPGWDVRISETSIWAAEPSNENRWVIDWNVGPGVNYPSAYPVEGLNASFNRTVYDKDGNEMYTRDFTSRYQSRGWQCTCSADMEGIPCW